MLLVVGDFLLVGRPGVGEVTEKLKARVEDRTASCSKFSFIFFYLNNHSKVSSQLLSLENYTIQLQNNLHPEKYKGTMNIYNNGKQPPGINKDNHSDHTVSAFY